MQETLVIEITKDNPTKPNWACFNADGDIIDEALLGNYLLLQSLAVDRHVIVLLPATDMILLNVQLPPMNRQRLLQALPFAIEEQVLQDVERLHIAPLFTDHIKEGNLPVLITDRLKMQEWLEQLKNMGVSPNVMTSTLFALPYTEHDITLFLEDPLLLRVAKYKGFVCDVNNLASLLAPSQRGKSQLTIHVYRELSNPLSLPVIPGITIEEKPLTRKMIFQTMARFVLSETPINLLQGRYFSRTMRLPKGLLFQTLLLLSATWFILLFAYPLVSYGLLKMQLKTLDSKITMLYKKQFPEATTINAPKIRFEDTIAQLTSAENENKLLLWLAYFGVAMKDVPSVAIKHLNYTDQEMTLEVTASSAQDVSLLVSKLSEQGLSITQQNANLSGDKVSVNLLVGSS